MRCLKQWGENSNSFQRELSFLNALLFGNTEVSCDWKQEIAITSQHIVTSSMLNWVNAATSYTTFRSVRLIFQYPNLMSIRDFDQNAWFRSEILLFWPKSQWFKSKILCVRSEILWLLGIWKVWFWIQVESISISCMQLPALLGNYD